MSQSEGSKQYKLNILCAKFLNLLLIVFALEMNTLKFSVKGAVTISNLIKLLKMSILTLLVWKH